MGAGVAVAFYRYNQNNRYSAHDALDRTFAVASAPHVVVESFNGPIEVVPGSDHSVVARVTRQAMGYDQPNAEANLQEIDVAMTSENGTVRIAVHRPEAWLPLGNRSAAVQLKVPTGSVLDLSTSNGEVTVTGAVGNVKAQTSNGLIKVAGGRGELKLYTNNGPIRVEGGVGQLDLRTSNGPIEISQVKDAVVTAQTSNGSIRLAGQLANHDQNLSTSNGNIVLGMPAAAQFRIDARTSNGNIHTPFAVQKTGRDNKKRLQGLVGPNPGMTLKLKTSNGNIDIQRE